MVEEQNPQIEREEILINKSAVIRYAKQETGLSVSDKIINPLNEEVKRLIQNASKRAKLNKRKTLKERDI